MRVKSRVTLLGLALFKIDHSCAWGLRHFVSDMHQKSDCRDVLSVRCPTCGVPTGVRSKLSTRSPRIARIVTVGGARKT